ncbi:phosphoribosylanthranilate isomerase [Stigmatella hybrida]|uniref:phosphoribosylanthranilate isomerase n=1 Tax=Stigmatella hybrida TaxID=394097 RepID=UPI001CDADCB3|nr:phosphoribosylanthranilate isomerase [Stigmatella hybrida]
MEPVARVRVKVCCIMSEEEALLAVRHGAAALGLVSHMPSGPGVISEERIAQIAAKVPPPVGTFLLSASTDVDALVAQHQRTRTNTLQLVDSLPAGHLQALRERLPGVRLVQVIHVTGPASLDEALSVAPWVDALLLDSGNPTLAVKELGGTGRVHDWEVSRRIREQASIPVFLAGGLRPENVLEAVRQVGPYGLDICSGLRTDGRLDEDKAFRFFRALDTLAPLARP